SDGSADSRIGAVTPMTLDEFEAWTRSGDIRKALAWQPEPEPAPEPAAEPAPDLNRATALRAQVEEIVRERRSNLDVNRLARRLDAEPSEIQSALLALVGKGVRYNRRTGRFSRAPRTGPMDALQFIAARGNLRDDED